MIETTLNSIIGFIGTIYLLLILFGNMEIKWGYIISITAFIMIITILLLGKFIFNIW